VARHLLVLPTEPTPLAFQRELWQLPLGKDTIQSVAKPYADVRVKHIVDFALEAERKCGHRQLVVNTITKNYTIASMRYQTSAAC